MNNLFKIVIFITTVCITELHVNATEGACNTQNAEIIENSIAGMFIKAFSELDKATHQEIANIVNNSIKEIQSDTLMALMQLKDSSLDEQANYFSYHLIQKIKDHGKQISSSDKCKKFYIAVLFFLKALKNCICIPTEYSHKFWSVAKLCTNTSWDLNDAQLRDVIKNFKDKNSPQYFYLKTLLDFNVFENIDVSKKDKELISTHCNKIILWLDNYVNTSTYLYKTNFSHMLDCAQHIMKHGFGPTPIDSFEISCKQSKEQAENSFPLKNKFYEKCIQEIEELYLETELSTTA